MSIEKTVRAKFHHLAEKYSTDIDKIGNIIMDWEDCRDKIKTKVRKLRSKNYSEIIEIQAPVRFYWDKEGYDGFEFGPIGNCSKYQITLLHKVVEQLAYEHDCACVASFMEDHYKEEWSKLLHKVEEESKTLGIPKPFFDAFKEKKFENKN